MAHVAPETPAWAGAAYEREHNPAPLHISWQIQAIIKQIDGTGVRHVGFCRTLGPHPQECAQACQASVCFRS